MTGHAYLPSMSGPGPLLPLKGVNHFQSGLTHPED